VAIGMGLLTLGMWYTMHVTPQTNYATFVSMRILQVLGLPFLFIPISTLAFKDIPKDKSSKASALYALSRNMGGSIGIAVMASYFSRHQQIHQSTMAAHLSPADPVYHATLAGYIHQFVSHGYTMIAATQASMGHLYRELLHQATIQAYNDTYMAMAFFLGLLTLLALFMPRNNPHAKKPADAAAAH
jgi:DHA2 family multidrug resistance protein